MKVTLEPFKGKRIFNCLHCHTVLKEGEEEVCGECEEKVEPIWGIKITPQEQYCNWPACHEYINKENHHD